MSFEEYGLSPELLNGLADVRIKEPTPLQNEVLPAALQGKHMLVKHEAGDEGTYLIPALQKIAGNGEADGTQALILTPSIEKAKIIDEMVWAMGYHAQISSALLSMKGNREEQQKAVLDGAPVIVANPGRLIEILEKNNFKLQNLNLIVIEEADEMDNFNLVNRVKDILKYVEGEPQVLIFSDKQNNSTRQLSDAALKNPELIGFDESDANETQASANVDLEAAEERLKKASVQVVLNPADKEEKAEQSEKSEEADGEENTIEKKLEEADVEVVLNPDDETEETHDSDSENEEVSVEKKLEEADVEVVLNPDDDSEETSDSSSEDEDISVEKKLEEAEVDVVLNPDTDSEESTDSDSQDEEVSVEKKLEEAEVEVVLNPDETTDTDEDSDAKKEPADVDLKEAQQKLKEVSVKVVLKKDLPDKTEEQDSANEQESDEVEPVMAESILQKDPDLVVDKSLEQGYINVPPRMKISTLMAHLEESKAKKVMVFAASKRTTDRLFRIIRKKNWGVVSINEGIEDGTYKERFAKFTSGEMRILLIGGMKAEDVEIELVEEVINYDVPNETEEYRYRAELVGKGQAARIISLVSKMDRDDIDRISKEVGYPPNELPLPEELEDKKKSGKKEKEKGNKKKSPQNKGRNKDRKKERKRVKKHRVELPRPKYDGLSGGRDGKKKKEKSGGLFGWVKGLFD